MAKNKIDLKNMTILDPVSGIAFEAASKVKDSDGNWKYLIANDENQIEIKDNDNFIEIDRKVVSNGGKLNTYLAQGNNTKYIETVLGIATNDDKISLNRIYQGDYARDTELGTKFGEIQNAIKQLDTNIKAEYGDSGSKAAVEARVLGLNAIINKYEMATDAKVYEKCNGTEKIAYDDACDIVKQEIKDNKELSDLVRTKLRINDLNNQLETIEATDKNTTGKAMGKSAKGFYMAGIGGAFLGNPGALAIFVGIASINAFAKIASSIFVKDFDKATENNYKALKAELKEEKALAKELEKAQEKLDKEKADAEASKNNPDATSEDKQDDVNNSESNQEKANDNPEDKNEDNSEKSEDKDSDKKDDEKDSEANKKEDAENKSKDDKNESKEDEDKDEDEDDAEEDEDKTEEDENESEEDENEPEESKEEPENESEDTQDEAKDVQDKSKDEPKETETPEDNNSKDGLEADNSEDGGLENEEDFGEIGDPDYFADEAIPEEIPEDYQEDLFEETDNAENDEPLGEEKPSDNSDYDKLMQELNNREKELDNRENELNSRESELDNREENLNAKEFELNERETDLSEKEKQFENEKADFEASKLDSEVENDNINETPEEVQTEPDEEIEVETQLDDFDNENVENADINAEDNNGESEVDSNLSENINPETKDSEKRSCLERNELLASKLEKATMDSSEIVYYDAENSDATHVKFEVSDLLGQSEPKNVELFSSKENTWLDSCKDDSISVTFNKNIRLNVNDNFDSNLNLAENLGQMISDKDTLVRPLEISSIELDNGEVIDGKDLANVENIDEIRDKLSDLIGNEATDDLLERAGVDMDKFENSEELEKEDESEDRSQDEENDFDTDSDGDGLTDSADAQDDTDLDNSLDDFDSDDIE